MKAFTIDEDNNITFFESRKLAEKAAAGANGVAVFTNEAELLRFTGAPRLVQIWNSMPGVTPVKTFQSAATGARRVFKRVLELEAAKPAPSAEPEAKPAKVAKAARAEKPAKDDGPRGSSKQARVIEMLKRDGGATLEEICSATDWQKHTIRALMSQGGALKKKHGIEVVSENVDGVRTYRIA